jgi:hypothetical protein
MGSVTGQVETRVTLQLNSCFEDLTRRLRGLAPNSLLLTFSDLIRSLLLLAYMTLKRNNL